MEQGYEVEGQSAGGSVCLQMVVWLQANPFLSLGLSFPHLHSEGARGDLQEKTGTQRDKEGKGRERSRLKSTTFPHVSPREESVPGWHSSCRLADMSFYPRGHCESHMNPAEGALTFHPPSHLLPHPGRPIPETRAVINTPAQVLKLVYAAASRRGSPGCLSEAPKMATTFSSHTI